MNSALRCIESVKICEDYISMSSEFKWPTSDRVCLHWPVVVHSGLKTTVSPPSCHTVGIEPNKV